MDRHTINNFAGRGSCFDAIFPQCQTLDDPTLPAFLFFNDDLLISPQYPLTCLLVHNLDQLNRFALFDKFRIDKTMEMENRKIYENIDNYQHKGKLSKTT